MVGLDLPETDRAGEAVRPGQNSAAALQTPAINRVTWAFRCSAAAAAETWNWEVQSSPPVRLLQPIRETRASRHARHLPVTAFSMTNDDHVWLESGLEHDLLRKCDRNPNVRWAGVLTYFLAADSPRGVWQVRTQFPVRHDPLVEFGALTPYFNRARSSIVPKPSTACR